MVRIHTGQTVTGTVVQITDDEVCVNIGYKSDGLIKKADMVEMEVSEKTGALKEHYWVNLSRFNGMPGLIIAEESIVDALDRMTEEDIEHIQGIAIERYHGDTYESMEDTIEFSAFMSCYRFARYILEGMYRCPNDFEIPDNRE